MGQKGNGGQPNDQRLMRNTHKVAHSAPIRSTLHIKSRIICKHSVPLDVKGVSMQGGHDSVQNQNNNEAKKKGKERKTVILLVTKKKSESQWIVELTSSGRVDAVKKGPFPLIIYFPIRHCPARGKNTFI